MEGGGIFEYIISVLTSETDGNYVVSIKIQTLVNFGIFKVVTLGILSTGFLMSCMLLKHF